MKTIEVNLYEFDELSDAAKEKARDWWRQCEAETFGHHGELFDDTERIAEILGITFERHNVPLMGGSKRSEPNIRWQLHVQGSGASFSGRYAYGKDSVKQIMQYAPNDRELHRIARELQQIQRHYSHKLTARITTDGREVHKYAMDLEAFKDNGDYANDADTQDLLELMRDFADWIYAMLQQEWEYRMSDENVDESIRINEYTFRENGKRSDG